MLCFFIAVLINRPTSVISMLVVLMFSTLSLLLASLWLRTTETIKWTKSPASWNHLSLIISQMWSVAIDFNFEGLTLHGKLNPAGRPESWRARCLLPSFPCHLSLHLLLLFIFLLCPPLLKKSSSAPQLTVLFLVLCATCCLKTQLQLLVHQSNNTLWLSKCICVCVRAGRTMCVYPKWHEWWGRECTNMGGVCRMLTKGLLKRETEQK